MGIDDYTEAQGHTAIQIIQQQATKLGFETHETERTENLGYLVSLSPVPRIGFKTEGSK